MFVTGSNIQSDVPSASLGSEKRDIESHPRVVSLGYKVVGGVGFEGALMRLPCKGGI